MTQPLDQHWAIFVGMISAVFAFVFDQPIHVVFAAFSGTLFAIGLLDSMSTGRAIVFIVAGTFLGAMVTHATVKFYPLLDARVSAFFAAFICLRFREDLLGVVKNFINKWGT